MGWPRRDRAAVDVDLLAIPLKQLTDGQRLDGKSLVSFDKIHLVQRPAGALQRFTAGAHRADAHHRWVDPATAELTMRASTGSPSSCALSTRISRTAARRRSATRRFRQ